MTDTLIAWPEMAALLRIVNTARAYLKERTEENFGFLKEASDAYKPVVYKHDTSNQLLACPWCGFAGKLTPPDGGDFRKWWTVCCSNKTCDMDSACSFDTQQEAVKVWNTRAPVRSEMLVVDDEGCAKIATSIIEEIWNRWYGELRGRATVDQMGAILSTAKAEIINALRQSRLKREMVKLEIDTPALAKAYVQSGVHGPEEEKYYRFLVHYLDMLNFQDSVKYPKHLHYPFGFKDDCLECKREKAKFNSIEDAKT